MYYKAGNYQKALEYLKPLIEKYANSAELNYHLGMTYYKLKDIPSARKHLKSAVGSKQVFTGKDNARKVLSGIGG